jgi:hypothetical protein
MEESRVVNGAQVLSGRKLESEQGDRPRWTELRDLVLESMRAPPRAALGSHPLGVVGVAAVVC